MSGPDRMLTAFSVSDQEARSSSPSQTTDYGYALPGRWLAQVTVICMVIVFLAIVTIFLAPARPWIVPICLSLIPLLALALLATVLLAEAGKEVAPLAPLLAGWAVVLGGAACDTFATVAQSPDRGHEANPVFRALLDNGVSLAQVFLFGGVLQVVIAKRFF